MESSVSDESMQILIDFKSRSGLVETSLPKFEDLAKKSAKALEKARGTIHYMAEYAIATIHSIEEQNRPTKIEMEFGIDFDVEADVLIAKSSVQSSIKVKLSWEQK
jgi:hypothetical protein